MKPGTIEHLEEFVENNGINHWPFSEVINEYKTTQQIAEDYETV